MQNPSGLTPLEFNVLVRPKKVEERTKGGVFMPDAVREKEQVAGIEGEVIAVSETAFTFEQNAPRAAPGDHVVFAKYAGMRVKGMDGEDYLILKDKDVSAVFTK